MWLNTSQVYELIGQGTLHATIVPSDPPMASYPCRIAAWVNFLFEPYHREGLLKALSSAAPLPTGRQPAKSITTKVIRQTKTADQDESLSISARLLVKICELRAKGTTNDATALNRAG